MDALDDTGVKWSPVVGGHDSERFRRTVTTLVVRQSSAGRPQYTSRELAPANALNPLTCALLVGPTQLVGSNTERDRL
jgi:hypothetical protein